VDISQSNWNEVDASNTTPPPDGWPAGMAPSGVEPGNRAIMGAVKRFWNRTNTTQTTAGTSTAYTLTYGVAPAAYVNGEQYSFVVNQACGASPTLNINALGAVALRKFVNGAFTALVAGDLQANQVVHLHYNGTAGTFDIMDVSGGSLVQNLSSPGYQELPGGLLVQWGSQGVTGGSNVIIAFPRTFSSGPWTVQVTPNAPNGGSQVFATSPSTTGFVLANPGSSGVSTCYWLAIGPK
jgi:hypothetical protein